MADVSVLIAHQYDGAPAVENRIIGLELRLVDNRSGLTEEVAVIPCDVRYPAGYYGPRLGLNVTVHTTRGDANFPTDALLP